MRLRLPRIKIKRKTALKVAVVLSAYLAALAVFAFVFWTLNQPRHWRPFWSFSWAFLFSAGMAAWKVVEERDKPEKERFDHPDSFYLFFWGLFFGLCSLFKDGQGWNFFIAGATGGIFGILHGFYLARFLYDRWGLTRDITTQLPPSES
jgi:uncharacterized membrane protein YfcA